MEGTRLRGKKRGGMLFSSLIAEHATGWKKQIGGDPLPMDETEGGRSSSSARERGYRYVKFERTTGRSLHYAKIG